MRNRQAQLRRERLQVLIVCLATFVAVGLGFTFAMTSVLPPAFRSLGLWQKDGSRPGAQGRDSSDRDGAKAGQQARSGTIVPSSFSDQCKQLTFNNDTGGVSETNKPCKPEIVLDANGVQVPQGTLNRMDAISKAFSKDR
jgi:hypothetical protein